MAKRMLLVGLVLLLSSCSEERGGYTTVSSDCDNMFRQIQAQELLDAKTAGREPYYVEKTWKPEQSFCSILVDVPYP